MDTGNRRYAVYAVVYLAPYLRSNLSLSPEDSWLPIASIILGIIHVQLEASIRNGDIQALQLFSEASKHFKPISREKDVYYDAEDTEETSEEGQKSRANLRQWDGCSHITRSQRLGWPFTLFRQTMLGFKNI